MLNMSTRETTFSMLFNDLRQNDARLFARILIAIRTAREAEAFLEAYFTEDERKTLLGRTRAMFAEPIARNFGLRQTAACSSARVSYNTYMRAKRVWRLPAASPFIEKLRKTCERDPLMRRCLQTSVPALSKRRR